MAWKRSIIWWFYFGFYFNSCFTSHNTPVSLCDIRNDKINPSIPRSTRFTFIWRRMWQNDWMSSFKYSRRTWAGKALQQQFNKSRQMKWNQFHGIFWMIFIFTNFFGLRFTFLRKEGLLTIWLFENEKLVRNLHNKLQVLQCNAFSLSGPMHSCSFILSFSLYNYTCLTISVILRKYSTLPNT